MFYADVGSQVGILRFDRSISFYYRYGSHDSRDGQLHVDCYSLAHEHLNVFLYI